MTIKITEEQKKIIQDYLLKFEELEKELKGLLFYKRENLIYDREKEAKALWEELDNKINIKSFDFDCDANDIRSYEYQLKEWLRNK